MQYRHDFQLTLIAASVFAVPAACTAQTQGDAAVIRAEGAFLRGVGSYNLNTASADAINTDALIRWKQDLRKSEAERRELVARKDAGKKLKLEEAKQLQRIRERELRVNPTSDDIQNGSALNALLYDLTDPDITGSDWAYKRVELPKSLSVRDLIFRFMPSSGSSQAGKALSRGVIALSRLDVEGKSWPTVLKQDGLNAERLAFEDAYKELRSELINDRFDHKALFALDRSLEALKAKTEAVVPKDRGFREEALKYISDLKDATRMFDAATVDYAKELLIDTQDNDARTVAELVGFMLKYRLQFASTERSASGRVLHGQLYEAMQQQTKLLGIKPAEDDSQHTDGKPSKAPAAVGPVGTVWKGEAENGVSTEFTVLRREGKKMTLEIKTKETWQYDCEFSDANTYKIVGFRRVQARAGVSNPRAVVGVKGSGTILPDKIEHRCDISLEGIPTISKVFNGELNDAKK